ncbi:hypothetical protein T05_9768 [Trichinella murrelli]|uniref:Uncharacterized protein n=1 Tax=Trichinella murrelli TaxID=144512 RepID=A0A0V0SU72_9BILA|nr:hypothetical protein T05_9768 [Trichinella murrelli]
MYKLLLQNGSRRNKLLRWDFKVHIRSRSSSTPIRPLSLYRPLRAGIAKLFYHRLPMDYLGEIVYDAFSPPS